MTRQELIDLVKTITVPLIKESGTAQAADVADLVRQHVEKAAAPPSWAAQLFGRGQSTTESRAKGLGFGGLVRAIAMSKREGSGLTGAMKHLSSWGYKDIADGFANAQEKALAASSATAGGYLVPVEQSAEVIELRRAQTVIRASGPREVPLPSGTLQVPKITSGATGAYIGENTNITKSQQAFGNVSLTAKKLAVLTPISNDLIRQSSPQADAVVRDDIVRSLAVTEDANFLRGDGTNGTPKGLRYWAPAGNLIAAASVSLANVATDLGSAMVNLMNNNVAPGNWTWIFAPRIWKYLYTVQNTNGFYAFRDELSTGKLWGFPFKVTTSVPITLTVGANADCSEVYLFSPNDMVIGDNLSLSIDVSMDAAYHDGSSVVAAFSQDQTVIRAIAEHDFAARYAEAISVITGVRWGV
ncbi:MAG: phage major capsid protein [Acidobacteria bacterium]|nr:phage major capsid protein [Acidobacteriota bacterium]